MWINVTMHSFKVSSWLFPFPPSVSRFSSPSLSLSLQQQCEPSLICLTERPCLTTAAAWTRLSSGPHTPTHLDQRCMCGHADFNQCVCVFWGGVKGVEKLFYVAVWEVREIIDCYNWCPLISWQHCWLPRGWRVSVVVCRCVCGVQCVSVCVCEEKWRGGGKWL